MMRITVALVLSLAVGVAHAQLGLPGGRVPLPVPVPVPLPVPQLPVPQLPVVGTIVQGADSQLNTNALQDARVARVRDLIRGNRATLEADPAGAAMLRNEVLAFSPSDADLAAARAAGFGVIRVQTLDGLDGRIVVLQAPQGLSTARALVRLRALVPTGRFDFNHVYTESGAAVGGAASDAAATAATPATADAPAASRTRLGLIDSGVDDGHPVFREVTIQRHGCDNGPKPEAHGTAVASLMVGRAADFHGAAPGAELYAADVYCGLPTGGSVDAVAEALAWLVHERVPVINVSLVGPPNAVLEAVVSQVISRGFIIVAAVGNDGPAARPLYPASYPGVIGVTAVDAHRRVLVEAARGPQVRFAAPGADMVAAKSPQGYEAVRGTSFAAPLVACLLAAQMDAPDSAAASRAINDLAARAVHLGAQGLNPVYGYGLVAADLGPDLRLAGLQAH
jgi:subtilisin family serine protease